MSRALVQALACVLAWTVMAASAQAPAPCPQPADVQPQHLLGFWRAEFEGLSQGATLLLEKHPEYASSLSGAINRNGQRSQVAADLEDGEFTLEESANGVNIDATWLGTVEDNSCGTVIKGTHKGAKDTTTRGFVLRKLPASR
jgi:hypothetical protein